MKTTSWGLDRSERGQATGALVIVILVVGVAVILLLRTAVTAVSINDKAESIARTGRGINQSTDAILQLEKTNQLGGSILNTAKPLQPRLDQIVNVLRSIDGKATTINASAVSINNSARGINGAVTNILGTVQSINRGVEQINRNVDTTIGLARDVKIDLDNVLNVTGAIHRNAACIDRKIPTGPPADNHC